MRSKRFGPSSRIASATLLAALSVGTVALATPSARLVYVRTPEAALCPDEAVLRKAVAARFGYDPFFPWAPTTLVVLVSRDHGQYVARVQSVDARGLVRGTREIASDEAGCSELFDATALAISIALDATAPAPPGAAAPTAATTPPAPASSSTPVPAASNASARNASGPSSPASGVTAPAGADAPPGTGRTSAPRAREGDAGKAGLAYALGGLGLGALGFAPSPGVGVGAFVEVLPSRATEGWSLGLEPLALFSPPSSVRDTGSVAAAFAGADLAPCIHRGVFNLCAVAQLGLLHAWRTDAAVSKTASTWTAALGARFGADIPLSERLFARVQADGLVNLRRADLELDFGEIWPVPSFSGMLGVGLGTRFP